MHTSVTHVNLFNVSEYMLLLPTSQVPRKLQGMAIVIAVFDT